MYLYVYLYVYLFGLLYSICIYIYTIPIAIPIHIHIQVSQVPTIRCPKTPPPARSPADPSRAAAFSRATSGKNVAGHGAPGCHGDSMGDITNVYDG